MGGGACESLETGFDVQASYKAEDAGLSQKVSPSVAARTELWESLRLRKM